MDTKPVVEQWNGTTWTIVASPTAGTYTSLARVKCPTTTTCFAVGHGSDSDAPTALIERWDGTSWTVSLHANP